MKHSAKKLVTYLVNKKLVWKIIEPFLKVGVFAFFSKRKESDVSNVYAHLFEKLTVLHGPFKGMKYPSLDALCSAIYPKLLGSYEKELHDSIEKMRPNDYSEIVDVGCAEGYYAVGFSLLFPNAKIYAYDIDSAARTLCSKMAKLNNSDNRIEIKGYCSAEELGKFNFTRRGLIVCDCEGFEMQLLTKENLPNLLNCDIIIEMHDFINIEISTYLNNLFKDSHNVEIIKSVDDYEKARSYQFKETEGAGLYDKLNLFREWRPCIMEWMVCSQKTS